MHHRGPDSRCSFCGKSQREVRKLAAGPMVFICDACVDLPARLLRNPPAPLVGDRDCSFCGKSSKVVEHVIVEANGACAICNECFGSCEGIIREALAQ